MAPATPTRRLVKHSVSYMVGQGAFFLSRLVFYCAFTRLFAPEDYGTLNLIFSALLFCIVSVRLGQNDAIVRLLPDGVKHGQAKQYVASIVLPMLAIGAVAIVVLFGVVRVAVSHWQVPDDLRWAFYFVVPIVGLRLGADLTYAIFRAMEKPVGAVALDAARNWLTIVISLALVFAWRASMAPFFLGQLSGEVIIFLVCVFFLGTQFSLRPALVERNVWRQALQYGLPMVVYHIAAVALLYIDRYLVLWFYGTHAVGEYSAGYNLAAMVQQIFTLPVSLAVVPLYMNLWSRGDHEGARTFVQTTMRWFWLGVWPCILGMVAVKSDLIRLLATEKYLESSGVVGYVLLGYILYGGYPIYAAGLLIHKKTGLMCGWMVVALVINVAANLVLIPRYYIVGAARATALSYLVFTLGLAWQSRRYLAVRFWPWQATVYLAGALVMFAAVRAVALTAPWLSLVVKLVVGVSLYGVWVLAADADLRRRVRKVVGEKTAAWRGKA